MGKEWVMTEWGERLHAAIDQRTLCGIERDHWPPRDPCAPLCDYCGTAYGVAFPAPPGRAHHGRDLPYFEQYALARGEGASSAA